VKNGGEFYLHDVAATDRLTLLVGRGVLRAREKASERRARAIENERARGVPSL
jgi:hypothetical protein